MRWPIFPKVCYPSIILTKSTADPLKKARNGVQKHFLECNVKHEENLHAGGGLFRKICHFFIVALMQEVFFQSVPFAF